MPCGDGMTEGVRRALSACVDADHPDDVPGAAAVGGDGQHGIGAAGHPQLHAARHRPGDDARRRLHHVGQHRRTGRDGAARSSYSESDRYASHFGIFEVLDVKVEVMGDLVIRVADGHIDATEHFARWSDKVRLLHFERHHIPVVPLEWQLVANVLLSRPERSTGIADYLLEHGFDRAYLDALLADEAHGERTIATVREMMHLDD